ncbi:MAG: HEAT repeat domain-containing protein [candidate division WOR-3 bacterium]
MKRWHFFETSQLDQPGIGRKLKDFAAYLDSCGQACLKLCVEAGQRAGLSDVDFLFDILTQLPPPPDSMEQYLQDCSAGTRPDEVFDLDATRSKLEEMPWERAEAELGAVAQVVGSIRVQTQQRIRQDWQPTIARLQKALADRTRPGSTLSSRDSALAQLESELAAAQRAEREQLAQSDAQFRSHLLSLLQLYRIYRVGSRALASVANPDALARIVATLCSDDFRYRQLAYNVLCLRNWQPGSLQEELDFLLVPVKAPAPPPGAIRRLRELIRGTSDVKTLLETLEPRLAEEGLTELQAFLLEHLCTLHSEKALDRLAQVLESAHEPSALKVMVAKALPDIPSYRSAQLLIRAMDDLDMEVRVAAATALGQIADVKFSGDAQKAGEIQNQAMERLVFALRDGDVLVREAAASSLRHYPTALNRLVTTVTDDRNPNARQYAALALKNFPASSSCTQALLQALGDEDAAVRKAAADALAAQQQIPDETDTRIRYLCARASWREVRRFGDRAVPCLVGLLRDRSEPIRLAVVTLLGELKARTAVKELVISLADSSQDVRRQTAIALRQIGDRSALSALKTALAKEGFREVRAELERTIFHLEQT